MRSLLLSAAALVGLSTVASAAPLLSSMITDTTNGATPSTVTIAGGTASSSNGVLTVSTSDASFSAITISALGVPVEPSPDLATQTTRASTSMGFTGSHTLTIEVTQTGLTMAGLLNFASTFTSNFLIGGAGVTSDVISNYYDASNTAFALTTLLGTQTCPGSTTGTCSSPVMNDLVNTSALFSVTEVLTATFTAASASVQSSAQLLGTPVPEPTTVALLGFGLVSLGIAQRRRRN